MKVKTFFPPLILLSVFLLFSCTKDENEQPVGTLYFPPVNTAEWETASPESLGWNTSALADLYAYLSEQGTRAFLVLQDGRIVLEQYWGKNMLNIADFNRDSKWYWASAGKSLTAVLVGIAQQDGLLDIRDKSSDYLGVGWSSMDREKEDRVTIRHHLTMTTGLDYQVDDLDCTDPECLKYKADAGTQWYYHNAAYTLLENVVTAASGMSYNAFTDQKLEAITGMDGDWIKSGYLNVYYSTARDMARFGLLMLNKGKWDETPVLTDEEYFSAMTSSSQELNPAYGYLWWLNGKSSLILPGLSVSLPVRLSANAPDDLIVAAGKNGQFADVIPSLNMVVIRMGEAPDDALVPILFHNEMWQRLGQVLP